MPVLPLSSMFSAPGQTRLPAWREDLRLQEAPRGIDGAPHWQLYDPVRNRFFRIGWLEFTLLSHWRSGMSADALCAAVHAASPLRPDCEDVLGLLRFLEQNELLRASERKQRARLVALAAARKLSLWQWLLHHYLFVRIPLVRPEAFLRATQGWYDRLRRPLVWRTIAALGLLGSWRVIDQWQGFSQTFLYFFSWQGALCYGLALGLSKLLHELGHAYTARHYGLRVPAMGVAIMMLWPLLYTDTAEGWRLRSRRARLAIDGAGIVAELMLAGLAAFAWSVLPAGPLKSAAYVLAAVTWISTLAVNLNPFMRFDGYYLLMDAIDVPNLHERSFALGRWLARRALLGWRQAMPETAYTAHWGWLAAYAYLTWLYRLVLFTGIAATVYYFFFKLAGIILFGVEIGWFVVRPIYREVALWRTGRAQWRGGARARASGVVLLALLVCCAIPWRSDIRADGYWQAREHTALYAPNVGRVHTILVHEGQQVAAGQLLMALDGPELDAQLRQVDVNIAGLEVQLARAAGQAALFEQVRVLQRQLAASEAGRTLALEERRRLSISAPHAGVVRDLDSGVYPGAWVRPQQQLARVVATGRSQAQIYVSETDVARLRVGARARLIVQRADARALGAVVANIDQTAIRTLPQAMLASTYGGPIGVRAGPHGELQTTDAWYRVTLNIDDGTPVEQLSKVVAHIDGERESVLWRFATQVAGVLIRESGL